MPTWMLFGRNWILSMAQLHCSMNTFPCHNQERVWVRLQDQRSARKRLQGRAGRLMPTISLRCILANTLAAMELEGATQLPIQRTLRKNRKVDWWPLQPRQVYRIGTSQSLLVRNKSESSAWVSRPRHQLGQSQRSQERKVAQTISYIHRRREVNPQQTDHHLCLRMSK